MAAQTMSSHHPVGFRARLHHSTVSNDVPKTTGSSQADRIVHDNIEQRERTDNTARLCGSYCRCLAVCAFRLERSFPR